MQRTADFHDQIADARFSQAAGVVDDATALATAVDVLDPDPATCDAPIGRFLRAREGPAPWLPRRHDHLHLVERERQEAEILEQPTARGQGVRGGIGNPLIVGAAGVGLTEKENGQRGVDQQDVFHRVTLFLAAIIARLLSRILGTSDAPFGPIMPKRGEAGAGAGGSAGVGGPGGGRTIAPTSASVTPRRWANAVKDRVGASPKTRRVVCSTTKRTWSH